MAMVKKTIIRPETTIAELEAELDHLGVADLHVEISKDGFKVSAVLHALESPSGRANMGVCGGDDLAAALRDLAYNIATMRSKRIEVIAPDGTLLGLYRKDSNGRRWARHHAEAYVGATIR